MWRHIIWSSAAVGIMSVMTPAKAGVGDMIACRKIEKPEDRLACYDREADKVEADLKVRDTGFFGLFNFGATKEEDFGKPPALPKGDSDVPEVASITSKIVDFGTLGGKQIFMLENGQIWKMTDYSQVHLHSSGANNARIERSLFGYQMTVNDGSVRWPVGRVK